MDSYIKIEQLRNQVKEIKAQLVAETKRAIAPAATEFFKKHDHVVAISWRQYTPYFNDGEPCVFSVGDVELFSKHTGSSEEFDPDQGEEGYSAWYLKHRKDKESWITDELISDYKNLIAFTEDEDTMEEIFGDHVQVTITRVGITVTEYDHE